MKSFILFCILLFVLFGCATTAKYEEKLQSWVGHPEVDLIASWGPPSSIYNLTNGSKILTYSYSSGPQAISQYNSFTNSFYTSSFNSWCTTNFTINSIGSISSWRWEGNACLAR